MSKNELKQAFSDEFLLNELTSQATAAVTLQVNEAEETLLLSLSQEQQRQLKKLSDLTVRETDLALQATASHFRRIIVRLLKSQDQPLEPYMNVTA